MAVKYLLTDSVKHLKIPTIKIKKTRFSEGELHLTIKENIKNKQVIIISNITPTNILEFLFTIDAAKRAGAKIKKIIIPFLSYARQDKLYHYGEAVSGIVICSILKNLKLPIEIYDVHSEKLANYLKFKHKSILPQLLTKLPKKDFIVISPDKGGVKRAKKIAQILKAPLEVIQKTRKNNKVISKFSKKLEHRPVLIVDDMISSGTTILNAVKLLKKQGINEIYCITAHGLFVNDAIQKLKKTGIKKIIVSNTFKIKSTKQIKVVKIDKLSI